ncbi:hypothetical protein ACGFW5_24550 [Streptomyces sp. NPDC048416]|uniref:hypothetical protein n=1 Tax=Streptomyces sp. NPDC048416 TaxID=3365546 RepID=UPI00371FAFA8
MNTFPPSMTTVSGTITGFAAACSIRASTPSNRRCGIREAAIRNEPDQPGRIGSGTSIRASSGKASTAFVPTGRSTAAQIRAGGDIDRDRQISPRGTPESKTTITSSGVESIFTYSPGRSGVRRRAAARSPPPPRAAATGPPLPAPAPARLQQPERLHLRQRLGAGNSEIRRRHQERGQHHRFRPTS